MEIKNYYEKGIAEISKSQERFEEFLNFKGRIFKNETSDLISIFAQNPNAQMIAKKNVWQKYGNDVPESETPIVTFDENGNLQKFYDWEQTAKTKRPYQWTVTKENSDEIVKIFNSENNRKISRFSQYIEELARNNARENINEIATLTGVKKADYEKFRASYISVTARIIAARCEFNSAYIYKGELNLTAFGTAKSVGKVAELAEFAGAAAKKALLEIERGMNRIAAVKNENERGNKNERNNYEPRESRERGVPVVLRAGVEEIYERESQFRVRTIEKYGETSTAGTESRQGGAGNGESVRGAVQKAKPAADNEQFHRTEQVQQHQRNVHQARDNGTFNTEAANGINRFAIVIKRELDNSLTAEIYRNNEKVTPDYKGYFFVYGTFSNEEQAESELRNLRGDFENQGTLWYAADRKFLRSRNIRIEKDDVAALRKITPPRKSVLNFFKRRRRRYKKVQR